MTLTRKSGLKRTGFLKRSGKLKKSNPERQAKRRKAQASKHRKYMRSETRRIVDARANGQCEYRTRYEHTYRDSCGYPRLDVEFVRCHETDGLQHHHLSYARYGGDELPEDVLKVCKHHHEKLEAAKPAGNRFSRSRQ